MPAVLLAMVLLTLLAGVHSVAAQLAPSAGAARFALALDSGGVLLTSDIGTLLGAAQAHSAAVGRKACLAGHRLHERR